MAPMSLQDAFRVVDGKLHHGMLSAYQMVDPTQELFDDEDINSIVRQYAERHEVCL